MKVKFSRCNSNSLANVPQVDGQLIYVKDTSEVYMDVGNNRNKLSDVIEVADITNVQNPVISKIYYDEATESLYKYVNNNWKNLSGSNLADLFVNIPAAIMQLTDESTPEEIFAAVGGKQKLQDIIVELRKGKCAYFVNIYEEYNEDEEQYGDEQPHLEIDSSFTFITRYSITSISSDTIEIRLDWRNEYVHSIMFLGVGYEDDELTVISDDNVGINRMDLVFPLAESVLEKGNTTPFTPTEDYDPATKKYVDDSISTYTPTSTSTTFDNTGTGLQATNVQDAIAELVQKINDLETTVGQVDAILDEITGE